MSVIFLGFKKEDDSFQNEPTEQFLEKLDSVFVDIFGYKKKELNGTCK